MSAWKSRRQMSFKRAALLTAFVAVLGGGVYAANSIQVRRNANKMLEQARAARDNQNRGDALQLYESYLNFQPRDIDAIVEYAAMLESDTNPKARRSLLDCYERLLRAAPYRAEERKKLVAQYMAYQAFTTAKHHLELLLDPVTGSPEDPVLLKQLATCEFRMGRTSDGIAILRKLIATHRAGPEVYQKLAEVLRKENTASALEESEKVIEQLSRDLANDTAARVVRITHLYQSGRADAARAEIAQAAKEVVDAEKNIEFSLLLADYYARDKRFEAARDVLTRAIRENPNEPRLRTAYYQTLALLKDKSQADEQLKKAIELAANNDPSTIDLIDLMIDNRELDLARREIDRRYKGKEVFRPLHDYLTGRIRLAEGNWPEARILLTRCLEFFEKFPAHYAKAQIGIAQCHTQANNPERAFEAYARAAAANRHSNQAQLGKAEALLRLNRLTDAEPILREYAAVSPAARVLLVNAKLNEQLARPVARRNWREVDDAIGQPPYPVSLEITKAKLLAMQGRIDDGEKMLRELSARMPDSISVRIALAEFASRRGIPEALAILAAAEKSIGDSVPLRLAKANFAARNRDSATLRALAENTNAFTTSDRHSLWVGVAGLLFGLHETSEAAKIARAAASEQPFDLTSRMLLAQIYLHANQPRELDPVLDELKKLDGENGPLYMYATVMSELARSPKLNRDQAKTLSDRLEGILRQRETWTRPHVLQGEIALRVNNPDAALKHFRKAYDLGERDESTFRKYVDLALARGRSEEAFRILDDRDKISGLPADLFLTHALLEAAAGRGGARSQEVVRRTAESNDPNIQMFRGKWLMLTGDRTAAAQAFAKAVQNGPHRPEAWVALVSSQAADPAAAQATIAKVGPALQAAGDKVAPPSIIPQTIGACHEAIGDVAGAERAYLAGLQTFPTDAGLRVALADLYRRVGRHADADVHCRAILSSDVEDDQKRWARRGLAIGIVSGPGAHNRIDEAIKTIEPNWQFVEHSEDIRLKAFLMARDPFRRMEAHAILEQSAARDPLSIEELVQRATLLDQEGRWQPAESDLREATKFANCKPAHLIFLHRVQLKSKRFDAAKSTLDRIQAMLPGSWEAVAEQARYLAARGEQARAIEVIRAFPNANNADRLLLAVGPLLAELGCLPEAEAAYRTAAKQSKLPQRHTSLVLFQIMHGGPLDAIRTALALQDADCPPPMTKPTLIQNAIATRPRASIPPADRPEWDRLTREALNDLDTRAKSRPNDLQLQTARAAILDAQGDYDGAIAAYERILKQDGQQMIVLNNLAALLCLHAGDRSERPLQLIERAIAEAGPRGQLLDTRAMIRIELGQYAKALADLAAARIQEQRPVYDFHAALAADADKDTTRRNAFLESARSRGLKKSQLHPKEWPAYERLFGPE